ncbi:hypothetical protein MPER_08261, partial [Moniliophthora perniciosa FA553]
MARKSKGTGRKRGNQGHFKGEELKFLEERLAAYRATQGYKSTFIGKAFDEFIKTFPHYDVETNSAPGTSRKTKGAADKSLDDANNSESGSDGDIEEERQESTSLTVLRARFKKWFYNHRSDNRRASNTGWEPYWNALGAAGSRPKRLPDHKFYMAHPDYKMNVDKEFDRQFAEKHGGGFSSKDFQEGEHTPEPDVEVDIEEDEDEERKKLALLKSRSIALRVAVAKTLYDKEPKKIRKKMETENDAKYLGEVKAHDDLDAVAVSDLSPSAQKLRRTNWPHVSQKLADELSQLLGMHVVIIAGDTPETEGGKFPINVTEAGPGPDGKRWRDWDEDGFKNEVLRNFFGYLQALDEERKQEALKKDHNTMSDSEGNVPSDPSVPEISDPKDTCSNSNEANHDKAIFKASKVSKSSNATKHGGPARDPSNGKIPSKRL